MSEKSRELSPEEKLWAVKEYLSGKGSTYSIADKYGVTGTSIRRWVDRYKIDGEQAFHKNLWHHPCHRKRNSGLSMSIYRAYCLYEMSH